MSKRSPGGVCRVHHDVYSRMIVGWQASRSLRTGLAIDALEWRSSTVAAPVQTSHISFITPTVACNTSVFVTRNASLITPSLHSVGSKGDSYDNAMVESFNGLYKSELIYSQGPWRGLDDVEFSTLEYVVWFNNRRLHGEIEPGSGYTTPEAFEKPITLNSSQPTQPRLNNPSLHQTRGASRRSRSAWFDGSSWCVWR